MVSSSSELEKWIPYFTLLKQTRRSRERLRNFAQPHNRQETYFGNAVKRSPESGRQRERRHGGVSIALRGYVLNSLETGLSACDLIQFEKLSSDFLVEIQAEVSTSRSSHRIGMANCIDATYRPVRHLWGLVQMSRLEMRTGALC
jgi:hypothetical protein